MSTVNGGSGNDSLVGTTGNDLIKGYAGNDTLNAYGGNDSVYGGDGADSVNAGFGDDWVYGGTGNDTLDGGGGYDQIYGEAGNDLMIGDNFTYDDFYGGTGDDTIYAGDSEDDWAWGEAGNDLLYMGAGNDLAYGGADSDTIYGGAGNDRIAGETGNDSLLGEAGNDTMDAGAGRDTVSGGLGDDSIGGASGNDSILGDDGNDYIAGDRVLVSPSAHPSVGPTDTTLSVTNTSGFAVNLYWIDTAGAPVLFATLQPGQGWSGTTGSTHNWYLTDAASGTVVEMIMGAPNQSVTFGPDFDDTLQGGVGNDTVLGDYGRDLIYGGTGADSLSGGVGNDTVFGGADNDSVSLGDGDDSFGGWSDEEGDDTILAGSGNDYLLSGGGNDVIYGEAGNDSMSAGAGSDSMYGGAGSDQFYVTDDHALDYIDGGEDAGDQDQLFFANWASTQGVSVTFSGNEAGSYDFLATDGSGSFTGIEAVGGTIYADQINASATTGGTTLYGYGGDDSLTGGSGADRIEGGDGNDTLLFGSGDDTVYGGAGNDQIDDVNGTILDGINLIDAGEGDDTVFAGGGSDTLLGGRGADLLIGEGGNDRIEGGSGNDQANGDDGNDTVVGGLGNDTLSGGGGQDVFDLDPGSGQDLITDFNLTRIDGRATDQLDVGDLRTPDGRPVRWGDVSVSDDGAGNARLTFPEGESVVLQGVAPSSVSGKQDMAAIGIPCFVAGTRILVLRRGRAVERPVEQLHRGDVVWAEGQGWQPVLWIGRRRIDRAAQLLRPDLCPVAIADRALGNRGTLRLSSQHGVALVQPGRGVVLVRAGHLVQGPEGAVRRCAPVRPVVYLHLLLPRHGLIRANGLVVESFYPGPVGLAALNPDSRRDLFRQRPEFAAILRGQAEVDAVYGPRAAPLLSRREVTLARHGRPVAPRGRLVGRSCDAR
jgi:Ca2+-binding RTX toxin-like protein